MKTIYNIYESLFEGILSGMDNTLADGDVAGGKMEFIKWVNATRQAWDSTDVEAATTINNGKINFDGQILAYENAPMLPKIVKLGKIDTLRIHNQKVLDRILEDSPEFRCLDIFGVNVENVNIKASNVDLMRCNVKNITIELTPMVKKWIYDREFSGVTLNEAHQLNEIKIKAEHDVYINFAYPKVHNDVLKALTKFKNKCKKDLAKGLREQDYTRAEAIEVIMDVVKNEIDFEHLKKHCNSIKRLILTGSGKLLTKCDNPEKYLSGNDFVLEKMPDGSWFPYLGPKIKY